VTLRHVQAAQVQVQDRQVRGGEVQLTGAELAVGQRNVELPDLQALAPEREEVDAAAVRDVTRRPAKFGLPPTIGKP
jgi:hypothetical protein